MANIDNVTSTQLDSMTPQAIQQCLIQCTNDEDTISKEKAGENKDE
jgi:hypothetical protein